MKDFNKLKQLMLAVQNRNGSTLSTIFEKFAVKWGLKKNTVRNIYYLTLKKANWDSRFINSLGLDVGKIKSYNIKTFTDEEVKNLISYVDSKVASGYSIRKACLELANNDAVLMLRYQNKYRTIKKRIQTGGKPLSNSRQSIVHKKDDNCIVFNPMPQNVIPFKKRESHLTDKELQSLFLGLVRIVKSSAVSEVNSALKDQCNIQAIEIRNLVKKLSALKEELVESQRQNSKLVKELEIVKMDKVNNYAKFMQELKNNQMIDNENKN